MILIDTSAWIEYLRDTGSPSCVRVGELIAEEVPIATCDTVVMELLAGPTSEHAANALMHLLDRCRFYPTRPLFDSTGAADVYRRCRRSGFTPRRLNDCVIAAIALEHDLPVLHQGRDFERIAEVTGLRVES
ncbi:MAG: PIN domain nuclease [Actinomycetota bacterium]|nr:PIN domain nuclease [Actinomycetota bacterium]